MAFLSITRTIGYYCTTGFSFIPLAMYNGMDSAVCNPANRPLIESMKATEMLLGKDRFCRKYTTAVKNGFARK